MVKERPASAVFSTEARATTAPSDTSSQHTRSSSVSRPPAAKLARFRSVQDIAMGSGLPVLGKQQAVGQKSGAASLKSSRSHLAPPTAFLRFKGRFGGKSSDSDGKKKCGTISAGNTPVSSRRPSNRGDEETAVEEEMESIHLSRNSSQSSSSKSKKSSKVRILAYQSMHLFRSLACRLSASHWQRPRPVVLTLCLTKCKRSGNFMAQYLIGIVVFFTIIMLSI